MEYIFKSIEAEWQGFEGTVLDKDAPRIQREEMRMAFFAGAWVVVCQAKRMGLPDVPEEVATLQLIELQRECEEFKLEYMRRYAAKN